MKVLALFLIKLAILASPFTVPDCTKGWFPAIGSDGRLLCIKTFVEQNFDTLDEADDICAKNQGFLAPMSTLQQEQAARDSTVTEVSPYLHLDEPMPFYIGARKHRENSTFYWLYDKSEISSNSIKSSINTSGDATMDTTQNCLMFEWNHKQPNSSLSLKTTSCNCIVTEDCKAKIAGFICAKYTCPSDYEMLESKCYRVVKTDKKISVNSASSECKKMPGGNLATLANKKINDHFRYKASEAVFGLRCSLMFKVFEEKIGNCTWDDGTEYKYNNFHPEFAAPFDYKPTKNYALYDGLAANAFNENSYFGECSQVTSTISEYWHDGANCHKELFNSYICQALPYKHQATLQKK